MTKKTYALSNPVANAITNPGALGTIEAYISAVNRLPVLTPEREKVLATQLQKDGNLDAARELVLTHLRLVVSVARQYLGYGLPHADLIQEGNIGLMKAVKRFDPQRGVRLVSFAMHWIKAEINEYVIRNWRLVKVATTKAQRKLFFNLRSLRPDEQSTLSPENIEGIASKLNVRPEDVCEMEVRMNGHDLSLDDSGNDEDDFAPIRYLSDDGRHEPTKLLEQKRQYDLQTEGVAGALAQLDERSRRIIQARWLHEDGEGATLHELAAEFNVSAERIRQIEAAALKKMRSFLS